ncbi:MAG: hypothetical protein QNJ37_23005 [Crocosphaera sp.]|nr:hypothetical protein [Crocosphaera sp.]
MSNQNQQDQDDIDQNHEDQEDTDLVPSPDSSLRYPSYEIIPSPRTLQEYEDILSGSMDRIFRRQSRS